MNKLSEELLNKNHVGVGQNRTIYEKNIAEYNYVNEVIIVKNSKTIDRCTSSLAINS